MFRSLASRSLPWRWSSSTFRSSPSRPVSSRLKYRRHHYGYSDEAYLRRVCGVACPPGQCRWCLAHAVPWFFLVLPHVPWLLAWLQAGSWSCTASQQRRYHPYHRHGQHSCSVHHGWFYPEYSGGSEDSSRDHQEGHDRGQRSRPIRQDPGFLRQDPSVYVAVGCYVHCLLAAEEEALDKPSGSASSGCRRYYSGSFQDSVIVSSYRNVIPGCVSSPGSERNPT